MKDRFVIKRMINVFLMFLATMAGAAIICFSHELWLDQMLGILLVSICFFVLFLFVLEHNRSQRYISNDRENDFHKIFTGYLAATVIAIISSYLPDFLKPVILIPIVMTALGTQGIALCVGIFWNAVLGMALGFHVQELILYCLMTLFGAMLAEAMELSKSTIWYYVVIFSLLTMLPGIFYYLAYQEVRTSLFLYGAAEGILVIGIIAVSFQKLVEQRNHDMQDTMTDILEDTYFMVRELSRFSKKEYQHAKRVSDLAARCARIVHADEKVCAAAGFYYRIGIIEGEPIVESGVSIAQRCCFPEPVLKIISEYNGEECILSTVESAIVHMVDGLVKKMEVIGDKAMSTEWNQDMVIYQTLNEFSASGLYDKSGLSMNMFLNIREYLVKEEALL